MGTRGAMARFQRKAARLACLALGCLFVLYSLPFDFTDGDLFGAGGGGGGGGGGTGGGGGASGGSGGEAVRLKGFRGRAVTPTPGGCQIDYIDIPCCHQLDVF